MAGGDFPERDRDLARRYHGEADPGPYLSHPNFRRLLEARRDSQRVYCRHYSGGRLLRETTFAGLAAASENLARRLVHGFGLGPGDRVLVGLGNRDTGLVAHCALLLLGAVAVPVDPALDPETLDYVIRDSGAKGAILLKADALPADWGGFVLGERDIPMEEPPSDTAWLKSVAEPGGASLGLIVYTSGTTGRPKGVCLTQANLLANSEATRRVHAMDGDSVHMCVLPLFHVNALSFSFLTTLYSGSRLILNRSFYLPEFWAIIGREEVQVASIVPTIVHLLLSDRRDIARGGLPASLKYFVSAAAPLSQAQARAFYERFGLRINQSYGLSEAVNFSLAMPPELSDEEYEEIFLESAPPPAGCAVYGNEVAVAGSGGELIGDGELGEVVVRGFNVMQGYLGKAEATAEAFAGGWFHTGDLGWRERRLGREFFFLQGRSKDMAVRKGENVSLPALDERLQRIPGLEQCVAVAFDNEQVGEEIGIFVVKGGATPEDGEILRLCREALGPELAPKAVVHGREIPRTSTGKLKRAHLRPLFDHLTDKDFTGLSG